jgi:hypothetical protein
MKKDPTALILGNRHGGNQTAKAEAVRNEANSGHKALIKARAL